MNELCFRKQGQDKTRTRTQRNGGAILGHEVGWGFQYLRPSARLTLIM